MPPTGSKWYRWIADTSLPNLYAISAAIILAICLIYWLARDVCLWMWTRRHVVFRFPFRSRMLGSWRRLAFVHLPKCLYWLDIPNYREALILAVMLAANIVGLRLRAHSWAEAQKRAGSLAVINLVPLCTGISFGLPADLLHVDRQMLAWFHRWIGRICVLHSLFHCSLLVAAARTMNLVTPRHIFPIAAGCALVLVIPVTCAAVQRRYLQFAMKCHYLLAATAIGTLIYHLVERRSLYRWYLVGTICLWFFISAVVCIMAAWNRKPWGSSQKEVVMNSVCHFLWLDIELPLNRAIRPGQYVQLWMPRAGFRAFFQLPRFYVAFWENGPTQRIVRMVAEPQPGLTQKLYYQALKSPAKQSVMILGPYGHPLDFYRFGTILFVVEDIGFFRALSYIEMLVEASCRREVMVRKLEVLWKRQVGKDGPQNNISYEYAERICYFYGSIKIEEEVERYLNNHQCGAVAVAGRNLQLMVFDPDMCPAPDGIVNSLSDETPADRQDPPHQFLGVGGDKNTHQVRRFLADSSKLQYSSPKEIHTEAGNVEMNNHSKWVESRLAQGRRKPTITEL
ncbi:unnamed protein product [Penicillium nalgiovense]|nr:unnamed protein product [Penicillium nalgiovense]